MPAATRDWLRTTLDWFNDNLTLPRLRGAWRPIFWFRDDAQSVVSRAWELIAILRDEGIIVGYKDLREDEFWVRGHIPGTPLFPGVLMVEAAAQLCSIYLGIVNPTPGFFGFGGLEDVRFRATVRPGERLYLIGKAVQVHPRKSTLQAQGVVGEKIAFEATIIGVTIPRGKLAGGASS